MLFLHIIVEAIIIVLYDIILTRTSLDRNSHNGITSCYFHNVITLRNSHNGITQRNSHNGIAVILTMELL